MPSRRTGWLTFELPLVLQFACSHHQPTDHEAQILARINGTPSNALATQRAAIWAQLDLPVSVFQMRIVRSPEAETIYLPRTK